MTPVLKWWIMFCASISLFILAYILGAVGYMWHVDSTKLSTVILGLYALTSLYIGRLTYDHVKQRTTTPVSYIQSKPCWFVAELMFGFGILGNLFGILKMASAFANAEGALVQTLLPQAVSGLGHAAIITLIGVSCSFALKLQLVSLELSLDLSK